MKKVILNIYQSVVLLLSELFIAVVAFFVVLGVAGGTIYLFDVSGKGKSTDPQVNFMPGIKNTTVKVTYTTPLDVASRCDEVPGKVVLGCAQWWAETGKCEIIVPFPKNKDDLKAFQVIGHELYHCTNGGFHE